MIAFQVDAFIKDNSGGSPTGVVLDTPGLGDDQMQFIADQIGFSHTAFVYEPTSKNPNILVRFFSPEGEILNCGHGTIAAHYARIKHFNMEGNRVLFQKAKEGLQQVEVIQQKGHLEIFLKQNPVHFSPVNDLTLAYLLKSLSLNQHELVADIPITMASPGSNRFLVGIKSPEHLLEINPDFDQLKTICQDNEAIGCFLYCTDPLNPAAEIKARMFAPAIGINEDVINGNSSGCLGAYLLTLNGQDSLNIYVSQGHKFNRVGSVHVNVKRTEDHVETVIGGTAKIVQEIQLLNFLSI